MSATFDVQWESTIANLRRRLQADGKVIALGAFMSARKEALPILEDLSITPVDVKEDSLQRALAKISPDRVPTNVRRGITKKYLTALLDEVNKEPVTDEEVKEGIARGEKKHEADVAARRAVRASSKRSEAAGSADARGDDAGDEDGSGGGAEAAGADGPVEDPDDVDEEEEDEEEDGEEERSQAVRAHDGKPLKKTARSSRPHAGAVTDFERATRGAQHAGAKSQHHHHEDPMSNRNEETDEQYEGQNDGDDEGDEGQDEAPPSSRRRQPRQQQPQVIVVPQQTQQRQPKNRNAPPPVPKSRFFQQSNDLVRIYKRIAGGKRAFIGDFTGEDIGPGVSLPTFLKDFVDEENSEPNGRTTYECVQVDARGNEVGRPIQHVIESQPQDPQQHGAFGQVREAIDLLAELRQGEEEKSRANGELMQQAKLKAVNGGDMNQLLMLMMMDRMNAPRVDEGALIAKVMDATRAQQPQMPFMMPPQLPQIQPAPPSGSSTLLEKFMEFSMAQMVKPEPPPPSPMQQLKDMMELQAMMQKMGGGDMAALVKVLIEKQGVVAKPAEVAGVDNMMLTFEKLTTMVKALAPQINQGGWAGPIQGIMSHPEVQKALAGIFGSVTGQPGAVPPGQQTVTGTAAALPNGQPAPQQPQVTQDMRDAANAFKIAQTREVRAERLMQLVKVMYLSGYASVIDPVLEQARGGNVAAAQRFVATLIADIAPNLVSLDLINATLRLSAAMAGEDGKKMLLALEASEKAVGGGTPAPAAPVTPGTVDTPNAQVVPIAAAPSHAHHAAYMAQIEALEKEKASERKAATQPSVPASSTPHQPEVLVKEKKEPAPPPEKAEVKKEELAPVPPQTPPAEVVQFVEAAKKPTQEQPTAT